MIYYISTIFLLIAAGAAAYFYIKSRVNRLFHDFFDAPNAETPSQFGKMLDNAAQLFASRLMQSLRAQLANMNSITTRQAGAVQNNAIVAGLADNPLIGGAMGIPGIEKMIKKNPLLGLAAQYLVGKMGNQTTPKGTEPQGTGAGYSGNGHGSADPFSL